MSQIIGKVGMTPRGMYDRTRAYERLDVVTYQGSSWVAIVDVPAQISPAMGSDYWQLQARMGETGPQGPVGPQGNSAFDGTGVELVNNLTQGGQTAALSAEQGKILKQELTELESEVTHIPFVKVGYGITSKGAVVESASEKCTGIVFIKGVTDIVVTSNWTDVNVCFYDKDKNAISILSGRKTNETISVPTDAYYVCVSSSANHSAALAKIRPNEISYTDEMFQIESNRKASETNAEKIETNKTSISSISNFLYDESSKVNEDIAADLDVNNIDQSTTPSTDYDGTWDWQECWMNNQGVGTYDANEISTRLIPCYANRKYYYTGNLSGNSSICFYDYQKQFISGKSSNDFGGITTDIEFTTPSNCAFVKATCVKANISRFHIRNVEEVSASAEIFGASENGEFNLQSINGKASWKKVSSQTALSCDMSTDAIAIHNGIIAKQRDTNKTSCIKFPIHIADKCTIRMRVEFPDDIHFVSKSTLYQVLELRNSKTYSNLTFKKNEAGFNDNTNRLNEYPTGGYQAYLRTGSDVSSKAMSADGFDKDFWLGNEPMSIRFKGDCTDAANQDICLAVTTSSLRIYHKTSDSTIAEYSFSTYPTIKELYRKLVTDTQSVLADFEIAMYNIENQQCSKIIPCNVHLVTKYNRNSSGSIKEWDAFPYYFTMAEMGRIYTIEVLIDKSNNEPSQLLIDGFGMRFGNNPTTDFCNSDCILTIGDAKNTSVTIHSVEVDDKAISAFPLNKVIYTEGDYSGVNQNTTLLTSTERLAYALDMAKKEGYKPVGFDTILNMAEGFMDSPNRLLHISHDDHALNSMIDKSIREVYFRYGAIPSFAMHLNKALTEEEKKYIDVSRHTGVAFYVHIGAKDAGVSDDVGYWSYEQLSTIVDNTIEQFINDYGCFPMCWDFHHETENYNVCRYLKNRGFKLIFGGSGNGCVNAINRFRCKRMTVRDNTDMNEVINKLDNYYCL